MSVLDHGILTGTATGVPAPGPAPWIVQPARSRADLEAYRRLRREVFVAEQGMFAGTDADDVDDDPRTIVLLAWSTGTGTGTDAGASAPELLGGVRIHPAPHPATRERDLGWWRGSRLVVAPAARRRIGVGAALVRAACAAAEQARALRFDATVQARNVVLFTRLGWQVRERIELHGRAHVVLDWPVHRVQRLVDRTKAALAGLLGDPLRGAASGFVGDDGAPVPGSDLVAACDAILPSMVERDPWWAGWCSVLVNVNDLTAMGATPVGLLDAVGARDASFARRVLAGLADAAAAWGVPVLGGHTQLGVPAALSVTALGRTSRPVPGGGGAPGQRLRLTADLGGGWRPGYTGAQWDSTSGRTPDQLRAMTRVVTAMDPTAAKDVSMAGLVGTAGMLAEASGCAAVLDVAAVPVPDGAGVGAWFTCFPGYGMLTAHEADVVCDLPPDLADALPQELASRECGELVEGAGVRLRWPDGVETLAVAGPVTGLGAA
ncbi:MAG: MSMEG_0567/sll0787 family protein [Kineosporiaceae bacterium]